MNRRNTVFALLALSAAPFPSEAQQQIRVWRVGILSAGNRWPPNPDSPFARRMRELGYVSRKEEYGFNLEFEGRWAEGRSERLPELATNLVQSRVEVIWSHGTPATLAAKKATATIPIVFSGVSDPVFRGIVASLARPGGNVTGHANLHTDVLAKNLQTLLAVAPGVSKVGVLHNPSNPNIPALKEVQAAAQRFGKGVIAVEARTAAEIEKGFAAMVQQGAGSVIVTPDHELYDQRRLIAELAARNRLPSIATTYGEALAGNLLSYGENPDEWAQLASYYLDKILKGAKPADLPVQQHTKVDLVINMKTAKALGITIPSWILAGAARVIE